MKIDRSDLPVGSSFFDHMFGSIAGYSSLDRITGGADFIPINGSGKTIKIKGSQARWMGMRSRYMQKHAYEFCYPVATVIDRLAEYDLTSELKINRSTGKGKNNEATNEWSVRMRERLTQPNPLQSWEQFRGQQIVYKKVFGFCPVLPIIVEGFENQPWMCSAIINLPPWLFDAIATRNAITSSFEIGDVIKEYRCAILGKIITLKPEQVFILEDGFMQDESTDFTLPLSKLVGLDMAISNICAAMEADNVLLRKKGPLGFISHDAATKDQVSYTPMSNKYKKDLQGALSRYGLSWNQFQYVISRVAAKWVPMSYNLSELQTKETVVAGEKALCHRLGYPYILYEESETTYANGDNAAATVFQMNVIPNNRKDLNKYNKFFKAAENNCKIECSFDDVGPLQEDKKFEGDAASSMNTALEKEWMNDVITLNQWREARGYDKIVGDDVVKSEYDKRKASQLPPPANGGENIDPITGKPKEDGGVPPVNE